MSKDARLIAIENSITKIPDFPQKGILFRNIFPVFKSPEQVRNLVQLILEHIRANSQTKVDAIVGLDSRGFLLGPMIAEQLECAFIPIRKAGKLPGECIKVSYKLEYGTAEFEVEKSAFANQANKANVIIFDDLLATGGTMDAAIKLMEQVNVNVLESICIIELSYLNGVKKLSKPFWSLIQYSD